MDFGRISANILAQLTKSLTEEYLVCVKNIVNQKKLISESKDDNIIASAETISRYYEIRLQTLVEILERISNIMKEEGIPVLSENEILTLFGCKTAEELKAKGNDPELFKELKKNLKKNIDKYKKEGEN